MEIEFDIRQANAEALAYMRKESLDIYNRLHSVQEDVRFVGRIHEAYPDLPIIPNLRCGAWYVDPAIAAPERAYFKSTDGHFGNWGFNLRRPNLHLLTVVRQSSAVTKSEGSGFILVDSTRAGKRIPDALSKTVPIWCAVINRAMVLRRPEKTEGWDRELYCPPGAVSEQERTQIEKRLDGWARDLVNSSYGLSPIPHPLRPLWITPSTSVFPRLPSGKKVKYTPIICVSASKQVHDGVERRLNGFSYVQGSGDDHELWGMGLSPELFWQHNMALLTADRSDLPNLVSELVASVKVLQHNETWNVLPTPIAAVNDRIFVGTVSDMPSEPQPSLSGVDGSVSFVVVSAVPFPVQPTSLDPSEEGAIGELQAVDSTTFYISLAEGKKGQLAFLQTVLPTCMTYIRVRLERGDRVCVCCDSGRDAGVGVALAALQLFFDDAGTLRSEGRPLETSKESIRTRLQWIIASRPQANPSRVTLKRVNEFLLSDASFRRR